MTHPLVDQLRFTRSEWLRGLEGLTEADGSHHHGQMNSIGWIVGHLTWQEQRYLLHRPQGIMLRQDIQDRFAYGAPMSTPSLKEMLDAWRTITKAADPLLDAVTGETLLADVPLTANQRPNAGSGSAGSTTTTVPHREIQAMRQMIARRISRVRRRHRGRGAYRPSS